MSKSEELVRALLEQDTEELQKLPTDLFRAAYRFAYPKEAAETERTVAELKKSLDNKTEIS